MRSHSAKYQKMIIKASVLMAFKTSSLTVGVLNNWQKQSPIKQAYSHTERNAWNHLSAQEGPDIHLALAGTGARHSRT